MVQRATPSSTATASTGTLDERLAQLRQQRQRDAAAASANKSVEREREALVDLYTVNFRVQEAYVKRHLCMSTGANTKEKTYRCGFLVGGPEPTVEEIHDDVVYQAVYQAVYQGVSTGGTSYSNPYKTSPGAPGLGFRV